MTEPISYSELWNRAEQFHQSSSGNHTTPLIIQELTMKIGVFKAIDEQSDLPAEEKKLVKARTMGEILLTLTALSLAEDINVYQSLSEALQFRSIDHFNGKYPL